MIPYIFHASILLAGCFVFYWLFIRNETFFRLNRWVLVGSILLSLGMPFINVPSSLSIHNSGEKNPISFNSLSMKDQREPSIDDGLVIGDTVPEKRPTTNEKHETYIPQNTKNASFLIILKYLYIVGVVVFLLTFLIQLFLLLAKIFSLNSVKDGKYRIVELVKDEAPYSFWNAIFINPSKYDFETYDQIIAHEKIHIEQAHFFDKLIAEFLVIAFWFNPFVWLFRQAITNNLEYLTDHSMLQKGAKKELYQLSLLKVSAPQHPLSLTTNYNQSFLKNRIIMMNAKKSSARSIWKYLFILPLLGLSIITLNAVHEKDQTMTVLITDNGYDKNPDYDINKILEKVDTIGEAERTRRALKLIPENTAIEITETGIKKLAKLIYLKDIANSINIDSLPFADKIPKMPSFDYSDSEIKERLKSEPEFLHYFLQDVEDYERRMENWKEALVDANTWYAAHSNTEDRHIDIESNLRGKELHYLEQSIDPGWDESGVLGLSMTIMSNDDISNNRFWKWPAVQNILIKQLVEDGYIQPEERISFIIGKEDIYVNGSIISDDSRVNKYIKILEESGTGITEGFEFIRDPAHNHIMLISSVGDVEELRGDLLRALSEDGFTENREQKVAIEISGEEIIVNKKEIPADILEKYHNILSSYNIIPAPGKTIMINGNPYFDVEKFSISVGYFDDSKHIGTVSF